MKRIFTIFAKQKGNFLGGILGKVGVLALGSGIMSDFHLLSHFFIFAKFSTKIMHFLNKRKDIGFKKKGKDS